MPSPASSVPTRRQALGHCALAAATTTVCAALMTAATLARAPAAVIPLAVLVCIGCPLAMSWTLPRAIAVLRAARTRPLDDAQALATLRRQLARLPDAKHPLGL